MRGDRPQISIRKAEMDNLALSMILKFISILEPVLTKTHIALRIWWRNICIEAYGPATMPEYLLFSSSLAIPLLV